MKKIKNYISPELAKKKIARYKYWSVKDESGITISSSEENHQGTGFAEVLDKIISDNIDAEIQVKFGTSEPSSRQNAPLFIRINEAIEWIEPEPDDTIKINGVPHKVGKDGNVNINLNTPKSDPQILEATHLGITKEEFEVQLAGLRKENELQKQHFDNEMQSRLLEQTLKFKELMLAERESRLIEREQMLTEKEAVLEQKQDEINDDVKGYLKLVPKALGGLLGDFLKQSANQQTLAGNTKKQSKPRSKVKFEFEDSDEDKAQDIEPKEEEKEENTDEFEEIEDVQKHTNTHENL